MTARRYFFAAPVLIAAIGCTAFVQRTAADYERGQAPQPKFASDNQTCARQAEADQARFGVGGDMDPTHKTFNRMYDACMRASGYERKPEKPE